MIKEFLDIQGASAHDLFQAWRTSHQDGVFLTCVTRTRANLHGARCKHLGSGPPYFSSDDGFGSLTSKRKVCATESELLAWAAENSVTINRCQDCARDGLLGTGSPTSSVSPPAPLPELDFASPDEVNFAEPLTEGAVKRVLVNAYERSPEARRKCVEHYGSKCFICRFDFGDAYGDVVRGYIHVHHLKPISELGAEYIVDPRLDLRPVCPNCHAVLHRREPPYTLEEVRALLDTARAH